MIKKEFETVIHYQPGVATIDLYGDLTSSAGPALEAAYIAVESQNPEIVWLNFAGIEYINSTGIALLIGLLARSRQTSSNLMACGLRPFHVELLKLAGLDEYMPIFQPAHV